MSEYRTTAREFLAAMATEKRITLLMEIRAYPEVWGAIAMRVMRWRFRRRAQRRAFMNATVVCAGCGWTFPPSYLHRLMGMVGPGTMLIGAVPGGEEFARTKRCTRCESEQCLLVYERLGPRDITEQDVDILEEFWRAEARAWWAGREKDTAICDVCNVRVPRDEGGVVGAGRMLNCESCMSRTMDEALYRLREDPYYYGPTELSKARAFKETLTESDASEAMSGRFGDSGEDALLIVDGLADTMNGPSGEDGEPAGIVGRFRRLFGRGA